MSKFVLNITNSYLTNKKYCKKMSDGIREIIALKIVI